jgi:hypothetical protein
MYLELIRKIDALLNAALEMRRDPLMRTVVARGDRLIQKCLDEAILDLEQMQQQIVIAAFDGDELVWRADVPPRSRADGT